MSEDNMRIYVTFGGESRSDAAEAARSEVLAHLGIWRRRMQATEDDAPIPNTRYTLAPGETITVQSTDSSNVHATHQVVTEASTVHRSFDFDGQAVEVSVSGSDVSEVHDGYAELSRILFLADGAQREIVIGSLSSDGQV